MTYVQRSMGRQLARDVLKAGLGDAGYQSFLATMASAEVALRSNWHMIHLSAEIEDPTGTLTVGQLRADLAAAIRRLQDAERQLEQAVRNAGSPS